MTDLPLNQIIIGDTLEILPTLPEHSVDMIFADPPYNLQLQQELWRPNLTFVEAVDDEWDQFDDFTEYDVFTQAWLEQSRRVLSESGTIWVSGTYHNILRVGTIMLNLGYWILNMVSWFKRNAMPNFRGTRLKNDVEFVIWAKYSEESRYTFNHHQMKQFNEGKQLGSMWEIPVCGGAERLKDAEGNKLHSTQKPEELLKRIIIASTKPGNVVMDPFMGTGTTGAVAKLLRREWFGIEREEVYVLAARQRIQRVIPVSPHDPIITEATRKKPSRVPFDQLIEAGYLKPGDILVLDSPQEEAMVLADGNLQANGFTGSIHKTGAQFKGAPSCNGWKHWLYYDAKQETYLEIDHLRKRYRAEMLG
jgi:DNA modification methylase